MTVRALSLTDLAALLMGAAAAIDEALPTDPAPGVQNALREAARALHYGGAPDFDTETIAYLESFEAAVRRLEGASA